MFSIALISNWNPIAVPNQEIVLKTTTSEGNTSISEAKILQFKKQLASVGIKDVKIATTDSGRITISYFSDLDTALVKSLLASNKIEFDVFEINAQEAIPVGIKGNLVIKQKQEAERFTNSNLSLGLIQLNKEYTVFNISYKVARLKEELAHKSNTAHNIPEVRAGPLTMCLS